MSDSRKRMGLYPIDREDIVKDKENKENLNTAKFRSHRLEAVKDFLINELRYEEDMMITQTKWNESASIMWIECEDELYIHRIYNQAYKTRNQEVRTSNYFPWRSIF